MDLSERGRLCFGGSAHAIRLMVVDLQVHICSDNVRQNHVCKGHPTRLAVVAVGTHAFRWMVALLYGRRHILCYV